MRNTEAISVTLPGWRDLYLVARQKLEWIATIVVAVHGVIWRDQITLKFVAKDWDLGAFYSAAFDWSSIQTAFLFGVYAFFLGRSEAFLKAVSSSPFFPMLRQFVVRSLYLSMALTVLSLPFLVAPPPIQELMGYAVFLVISCLFVFTFFCFIKVIRVFGMIERH